MSVEDTEYFKARASTERALAETAASKDIAAIHEELARQYEALVEPAAIRPKLHISF